MPSSFGYAKVTTIPKTQVVLSVPSLYKFSLFKRAISILFWGVLWNRLRQAGLHIAFGLSCSLSSLGTQEKPR